MNLTDLYSRLALGELSNLAMAEGGEILEDEQAKIVMHANASLKRIYSRFCLKTADLILIQKGYLTRYLLTKKYAVSQFVEDAGHSFYIDDTGRPFENDLLKVLEVWDGYGNKLPLNDQHMWTGVFTPQANLLQVNHPVDGEPLSVHYQASHPVLLVDEPEQILELPDFLEAALTSHIAHLVFKFMNTQESSAKAVEHFRSYEAICVEAAEQDLVTTGGTTSGIRFEKNGWV